MKMKLDELIITLEQKQNRTSAEESALNELKDLENKKEAIRKKQELLSLQKDSATSSKYRELMLENSKYVRMQREIIKSLGMVPASQPRPRYVPPAQLSEEELKEMEELQKKAEEERLRKMREEEFEEWKRKKESGELEFEEYRMRKQFMQIMVQQQEEILRAIREGSESTRTALRENAETTAQADAFYQVHRDNYRLQDEMLREFFKK